MHLAFKHQIGLEEGQKTRMDGFYNSELLK